MTLPITLCSQREALLAAGGHLLVRGGPGSGKTTIALHKVSAEVDQGKLKTGQKALFLSFARATTSRVEEQSRRMSVRDDVRGGLEINTYHGFAWSLIQSYGYLVTNRRQLRILTPPNAAVRLSGTPEEGCHAELHRLLADEGLLSFDLFAEVAGDMLARSPRLAALVADNYPLIILDEFQDTNAEEWRMVTALGRHARLIALADPDQRIYEFRGADPRRISEFISAFTPRTFDFGAENHRSAGTDITVFGDELLTGIPKGKSYTHVKVVHYSYNRHEPWAALRYAVLQAIQRLERAKPGGQWSLAVLVNSKRFMLEISSYLTANAVRHDVLLDPEGPALAANLIAGLMERAGTPESMADRLIGDLVSHVRGRRGGHCNKEETKLAAAMERYRLSGKTCGSNRMRLVCAIMNLVEQAMAIGLRGDPEIDWLEMQRVLLEAKHEKLARVGEDARFLRLLNRGTMLREKLAEQWRRQGDYGGARGIVEAALLQEHFSSATRPWKGVHLMTIHKSKGKEFDEVVIFESDHRGRILRANPTHKDTMQAQLALRVAVTRAKSHCTILTPKWKPCPLLVDDFPVSTAL